MSDLIKLSTEIVDGKCDLAEIGPVNRINNELSEIRDGIAMVESFSHSILFETSQGLIVFDTSGALTGRRVVKAIRGWTTQRFHSIVYTHGHIDHVGGCAAFLADAGDRHAPVIVGHENVGRRLERYARTNDYNLLINARQFVGLGGRGYSIGGSGAFVPEGTKPPGLTYRTQIRHDVGGLTVELNHARGETDDHTWAWIPTHKAICAGDFFIWNFPNAGNPQKVQRYPLEWAEALRDMTSREAELFLPAHGLPIAGKRRINYVLTQVADVLETLVTEAIDLMNQGATLDDTIHSVSVAQEILDLPWLRPAYDEPEFVVRNIWRQYGGWYDGNPANLKPARQQSLARELAQLAGGANQLAKRAEALFEAEDDRLACHLIELATEASPDDRALHELRAKIYQGRAVRETSLMSKGIFRSAANSSVKAISELP
ncbi:MAG: MBL fold metallo-hydrolase [Gammaproteobacteria bacterium]|nr:MBL fold metallo-hydrolase [Gammaproteobacteria bacterium]